MCGRIACNHNCENLEKIAKCETKNIENLNPSFNIAPTGKLPCVYNCKNQKNHILEPLGWGIFRNTIPLINIRSESFNYVNQFKKLISDLNFCVIIIQGFFEWKELENNKKQPYYITSQSEDDYLLILGIYEEIDEVKKVCVVTQEANKYISFLHERMPIFLQNFDILNKDEKSFFEELQKIKEENKKINESFLKMYPVGNLVNRLSNHDENVIKHKDDVKIDKYGNYTLKAFLEKNEHLNKSIIMKGDVEFEKRLNCSDVDIDYKLDNIKKTKPTKRNNKKTVDSKENDSETQETSTTAPTEIFLSNAKNSNSSEKDKKRKSSITKNKKSSGGLKHKKDKLYSAKSIKAFESIFSVEQK